MKSNGVQSLFEKIENPLAAVLAEMEKRVLLLIRNDGKRSAMN